MFLAQTAYIYTYSTDLVDFKFMLVLDQSIHYQFIITIETIYFCDTYSF
jgi:hypothetical protein